MAGKKYLTPMLGLLAVASIVIFTAIKPFRHNDKKITTAVKQQAMVALPVLPPELPPPPPPPTIRYTACVFPRILEQAPIVTIEEGIPEICYVLPPPEEVEKPNANQLLQSFFQQLEKPAQEFNIDNARDTILVAREGTKLIIPANTLVSKAGPVKIMMQEYYKYEDIIAARLNTTSNGAQLVTGGMLQITAEQAGEAIKIAPDKAITVQMPTNNYDVNMQLFTGTTPANDTVNSAKVNWISAGRFKVPARKERTLEFLNTDDVQPASVTQGQKTVATFFCGPLVRRAYKKLILEELKDRFGSTYDEIKLKRPRRKDYEVNNEAEHPIIISTKNVEVSQTFGWGALSKTDSLYYVKLLRRDSLSYVNALKREKMYYFTISDFGWVNCDRYWSDSGPKVTLVINLAEGEKASKYISTLVFARYRSIITGYYTDNKICFPNVPKGEPVHLVTVSATGDKVVSNFQSFNLSNREISDLQFEPTTPELHKQKLQSLVASPQQAEKADN
ncbi:MULTISPECIES: hypothetical protein [Niastella]|uniref:FecR protein domain-containing protein n=1 Tax=Niastella soli TaxID=2821487 RepID=A0ABS3YS78_9BACT|nr:hypothetical protein [Niastella soli]MBO9200749.1 hypothetical protein [Niastella soli]